MEKKICLNKMSSFNEKDNLNYFGDWTKNLDDLQDKFINAKPFSHITIPNFLSDEYAELLYNNLPIKYEDDVKGKSAGEPGMSKFSGWYLYCNPVEVKYINDDVKTMPEKLQDIFHILSSDQLINVFGKISNINNLEYDPYLMGSGLHSHPRYGRNNMHLDYEQHPVMPEKERRLNIILYLTKDWKKEWHGDTQLWDEDMKACQSQSHVEFNKALIFQTNNISWHGVPETMLCPEGTFRKTLSYCYISPLVSKSDDKKCGNNGTGYRTRSTFCRRPNEKISAQMDNIYALRSLRRVEKSDMEKIWPEWRPELNF